MVKISEFYSLFVGLLILCRFSGAENDFAWKANFKNETYSMYMGDSKNISLTITNFKKADFIDSNATVRIISNSNILRVTKVIPLNEFEADKWSGYFTIDAIFIGNANLSVEIVLASKRTQRLSQQIQIVIINKSILAGVFMEYFHICVLVFYFVMYINFGVILEVNKVKDLVRKPLTPCVAFLCTFIISPLVRGTVWSFIIIHICIF